MDNAPEDHQNLKYVTNRAWWTPTVLAFLFLILLGQSSHLSKWWPVDIIVVVLLTLAMYIVTHPTLSFSSQSISQRRGPFRVNIDLSDLSSLRVDTMMRQVNAINPQTGQRRQVNFYFKQPDDWAGKRPAQGLVLRDNQGHRLALRFLRTDANRWGAVVLSAVRQQPNLDLGPRVIETLERIVR